MENLFICENPECRFVIDFQPCNGSTRHSAPIIPECPECGHDWSNCCPFCLHPLDVLWRGNLPHCSNCVRVLGPEFARSSQSPRQFPGKLLPANGNGAHSRNGRRAHASESRRA
jgi:hypothetical protein